MASETPSGQKRTIVLTGASDGIGAIAARTLAGPDTDLVLVGRSAKKLAPIAAETGARQVRAGVRPGVPAPVRRGCAPTVENYRP